MFEQKKTALSRAALTISVIILAVALVLTGCKKESVEGPNSDQSNNSTSKPVVQTPEETVISDPKPKPTPSPTESVISNP